jgi:hypothetical protein
LYVGAFGQHSGMHYSYHVDGQMHIKDADRKPFLNVGKTTPIKDVGRLTEFGGRRTFFLTSLDKRLEWIAEPFTSTATAHQMFLHDFGGFRQLSLAQFLSPVASEESDVNYLFENFTINQNAAILNLICTPLTYFKTHKLIVLAKGFN